MIAMIATNQSGPSCFIVMSRTLMKADGTAIKNNYRGVQLLNSRSVTKIDLRVPAPPNLDYTPSTNCVKKVVTGDYFDQRFRVSNVFERNVNQSKGSFWLGPSNSTGFFIIDCGCQKQRRILELVNLQYGERATKQFRLSSSASSMGPWKELVNWEMAQNDSLQTFSFQATTDQYYKFEIMSYYGNGGGVQYLDVRGFLLYIFLKTNNSPQILRKESNLVHKESKMVHKESNLVHKESNLVHKESNLVHKESNLESNLRLL